MPEPSQNKKNWRDPSVLFCIGWAIVFLALLFPLPQFGNTFIHSWRVDLVASLFLAVSGIVLLSKIRRKKTTWSPGRNEAMLILLPIAAFIVWSGLSAFWANSPSSVLHHTLIWSLYLLFFVLVRDLLNEGRNYGKLMLTASLCLAFFGILAIFSYVTVLIFTSGPSIGIIYMKYGEQINSLFPLLMIGVIGFRGRKFAAGAALLTILWLLIFSSLSRTNLILFVFCIVSVGLLVLLHRKLRPHKLRFAALVLIFTAAPFTLHIASLFGETGTAPIVGRVSDSQGLTGSNNFRKLMLSVSAEMVKANPLLGVGADNFGFEVNRYREIVSEKDPSNPNLAESEDYIPERAHNEFAQIAGELGIIGLVIFAMLLAGIAIMGFSALKDFQKTSPYAFAALLGIAIFLASSLVTSFSFRLIQNGFVFFFLLAVASKLILRQRGKESNDDRGKRFFPLLPVLVFGVISCISLAGYSLVRVYSSALTIKANSTADMTKAKQLYGSAMSIDSTNAGAFYYQGIRLIEEKRYAEAVPFIQRSIELGRARSSDLSYLATAQSLAGDHAGAESTFAYAVRLYPRSPFVLTRYAAFLKTNGKHDQAEMYLAKAREIDAGSASSWWILINEGAKAVSDRAAIDPAFVPVMDLYPSGSLYAIVAERDIRFPDERTKFPWEKISNTADQ